MTTIAIINYGMGNLGSLYNVLEYIGVNALICSHQDEISLADAIILPGVGAFHSAMENLRETKLDQILKKEVLMHCKPFLGICLGMQMLVEYSDEQEGDKGLHWLPGAVKKLACDARHPIPHVGWNDIDFKKSSILFNNIKQKAHFYFDHSYYLKCKSQYISATCKYNDNLVAAIEHKNIFAVQFHPEKSQENGIKLLTNFINYVNHKENLNDKN